MSNTGGKHNKGHNRGHNKHSIEVGQIYRSKSGQAFFYTISSIAEGLYSHDDGIYYYPTIPSQRRYPTDIERSSDIIERWIKGGDWVLVDAEQLFWWTVE